MARSTTTRRGRGEKRIGEEKTPSPPKKDSHPPEGGRNQAKLLIEKKRSASTLREALEKRNGEPSRLREGE